MTSKYEEASQQNTSDENSSDKVLHDLSTEISQIAQKELELKSNEDLAVINSDHEKARLAMALLMPILLEKNDTENWEKNSPATIALSFLASYIGDSIISTEDSFTDEAPIIYPRPLEAEVRWVTEYMVTETISMDNCSIIYLGPDLKEAVQYHYLYTGSKIEKHLTADLDWVDLEQNELEI